ncbi:hypothetical protein ACLQ2P_34615 [Actinomadura citrea]|uniref:hypothetical protein n=1 Tax=Actinomadura citrea TaxID=46158 RepID=UPI003CE559D1
MLAGLLLQRFWWGSVFLVAVPVMALLDSAHAAFTAGLHITGAVAAAIFAVLAVLVAASARRGVRGRCQEDAVHSCSFQAGSSGVWAMWLV